MADYFYDSIVTYNERGGGNQFNRGTVDNTSGSLNIADGSFDLADPPIPGFGDYIGYVDENGQNYPVFRSGSELKILTPQGATAVTEDPIGLNQDIVGASLPVCFSAGTLIATPEGEKTVETLQIGDLITTVDGRAVPVKWIGRQTQQKLFTPAERFCPVRVRAGALGEGLPHTDLVLTADHALIIDGLAINAGALVNGTAISYDPIDSLPERVTYYHIETEDHDIILANGAAAETYVDYIQRAAFDNYQEYLDLYGEEKTICEMDLPRVSAARLIPPAIKARLAGEAAA